ncbi:MAG: metal ABC transporter permease [Candidatus Sericytochromatia bacterium]|nr:metal ABC transporter permease [Candidatus Sericytochromatia bacterium]MEB3221423.1 metal ABC transporter permease [Candidatus Sericytochromatia bacterium]
MPEWSSSLTAPWFWHATLQVVVVGVLCSLVGVFLILRRLSLLADAVSHSVLPGVVLGWLVGGYSVVAFLTGAVASGLACVGMTGWITRHTRLKEDAAMGVSFSALFATGIVMVSAVRGLDLDPGCVVYGEPLASRPESLVVAGILLAVTLLAGALAYRPLVAATFDPVHAEVAGVPTGLLHLTLLTLVALATVAALRAVGIVLAIAFFITPGATAMLLARRLPGVLAGAVALAAGEAVAGMAVAVWLNASPAGVTATLGLAGFLLVAAGRAWRLRWLSRRPA